MIEFYYEDYDCSVFLDRDTFEQIFGTGTMLSCIGRNNVLYVSADFCLRIMQLRVIEKCIVFRSPQPLVQVDEEIFVRYFENTRIPNTFTISNALCLPQGSLTEWRNLGISQSLTI